LALRGGGGSRKGRPTGYAGPKKNESSLSNTTRAIQQRFLAAQRDAVDEALNAADAADRSAKSALKKRLGKKADYAALSEKEKEDMIDAEWEKVAADRFENCKSSK
jgi:acyl-CoA reductase-like NAD-dependent aldehyde dehydrogenase